MNKLKLFAVLLLLSPFGLWAQQSSTITDARDNNIYRIGTVGEQTWMFENLRFKMDEAEAYENDDANVNSYGYLYDWNMAQTACPDGWHLPSKDEWESLFNSLGGKNIAGGKLKQKGTALWTAPNRMGSNASGFNALPGGYSVAGVFSDIYKTAYFWGDEAECTSGFVFALSYRAGFADTKVLTKTDKVSVRCIKN